jgi:tRNA U55 pseudouridine synthase TruB
VDRIAAVADWSNNQKKAQESEGVGWVYVQVGTYIRTYARADACKVGQGVQELQEEKAREFSRSRAY